MTATDKPRSGLERFAWTVFAFFGAILALFGVSDFFSAGSSAIVRENAINEAFIGLLTGVVAGGALRRGDRWASYAMSLWPLWIVAQGLRAWSSGKGPEAMSAVVFLVLAVVALALSYRRSTATGR